MIIIVAKFPQVSTEDFPKFKSNSVEAQVSSCSVQAPQISVTNPEIILPAMKSHDFLRYSLSRFLNLHLDYASL